MFSSLLFFGLKIGWFTGVPMACAILLFEGDELARGDTSEPSRMRRFFVAGLSSVHVLALAMILLPHAKPTAAWRKALERPMRAWIHATVAQQGWVCRNFAVSNGGDFTVEFHRVRQSMPWPEQLVAMGPDQAEAYAEASRHSKVISEHRCPDSGNE